MRILFASLFFLFLLEGVQSQQVQVEFIPASETYPAYFNHYSESAGIEQYYLENSKWVKNTAIPSFVDLDKFKDIDLQFIPGDNVTPAQLFVYSQMTGDFSFYFLYDNAWLYNDNIPLGKIKMNSNKIVAEYSQANAGMGGYIFAYSHDDSKIELLEVKDGQWILTSNVPGIIPQD